MRTESVPGCAMVGLSVRTQLLPDVIDRQHGRLNCDVWVLWGGGRWRKEVYTVIQRSATCNRHRRGQDVSVQLWTNLRVSRRTTQQTASQLAEVELVRQTLNRVDRVNPPGRSTVSFFVSTRRWDLTVVMIYLSRKMLRYWLTSQHRSSIDKNLNKWRKNFDERLHLMSCHYWGLNDPFCCVHRSKDSQRSSVSRATPKIAHSRGGCRRRLLNGSLGPPESAPKRHLDRFSCFAYTIGLFLGLLQQSHCLSSFQPA